MKKAFGNKCRYVARAYFLCLVVFIINGCALNLSNIKRVKTIPQKHGVIYFCCLNFFGEGRSFYVDDKYVGEVRSNQCVTYIVKRGYHGIWFAEQALVKYNNNGKIEKVCDLVSWICFPDFQSYELYYKRLTQMTFFVEEGKEYVVKFPVYGGGFHVYQITKDNKLKRIR